MTQMLRIYADFIFVFYLKNSGQVIGRYFYLKGLDVILYAFCLNLDYETSYRIRLEDFLDYISLLKSKKLINPTNPNSEKNRSNKDSALEI
jgi:hypothetical protein